MEEDEGMFQPFWLQNTGSLRRTDSRRLRRSSSSVFFSSGFYVLALLAIALVFIFFIIPSVLSLTSQIFRPHLVRKSWDSLNLVLVLFAIVCGFLSRNTGNENGVSSPSSYDQSQHPTVFNASGEVQKSNPSTPRLWYDQYADRTAYINSSGNTMMNRGVRTSSSYPDLRQQESSWNVARDERWRFYDDTHVANYRASGSDQLHHRRHRSWHEESVHFPVEEVEAEHVEMTRNIPVDTYVIRTEQVVSSETPILTTQSDPQPRSPPPRSPSPAATLPPRKTKRTYQALGDREKSTTDENLEAEKNLNPPPSHPPPSPPSPPFPPPKSKEVENMKSAGKNVKKRGVGVATTKEFLITSLRRRKKKQRQKSVENFDTLLTSHSASSTSLFPPPSPPPPPPPLPPPPSVFHNLFSSKKSYKPKKSIQSFPQPPPPSPPPPPAAATISTARLSKTKPQTRPMTTTQKPPLPVQVSNFDNVDDENSNSGGESPLGPSVRIPPPPPLPPFRIPETKFVVVHGDFVRINSNDSSRSGSPDLEYDGDRDSIPSPTVETSSPILGGESPNAAMFCPSPDVNTKAETFIARIRAGMRLEKMNSVQERQGMSRGKSKLGPSY